MGLERDPSGLPSRGLTDAGRGVVAPMVLAAWDDFLAVAEGADLQRRTRLPGWRVHEVLTHLGSWPDYRALDGLVAGAQQGRTGPPPDVDGANARVTAARATADQDEVLEALRRHRDDVERYFREHDEALDGAPTPSPVGPLPLLSVIAGEAYELAVHALDVADAGGPDPAPGLLSSGIAALADVTGALAAGTGITAGATLQTPAGGWSFRADAEGWRVTQVAPGRTQGATVSADPATLLDASAGRGNPVALLARRKLAVQDLGGLLALAPIVEVAPNIPGGPILRLAARSVGRAGLFGRRK